MPGCWGEGPYLAQLGCLQADDDFRVVLHGPPLFMALSSVCGTQEPESPLPASRTALIAGAVSLPARQLLAALGRLLWATGYSVSMG